MVLRWHQSVVSVGNGSNDKDCGIMRKHAREVCNTISNPSLWPASFALMKAVKQEEEEVCVCVCVCVCLLSHISLQERLFILKIQLCAQRATEVKKVMGLSLKPLRSRVMA